MKNMAFGCLSTLVSEFLHNLKKVFLGDTL